MKFAHFNGPRVEARPFRDSVPRASAARRSRLACLPSMRRAALCTAFAWASLTAGAAMAEANPDATPEAPEADLKIQATQTDQWTGFWNRQQMLGDIGGLRPWLGKYGLSFNMHDCTCVTSIINICKLLALGCHAAHAQFVAIAECESQARHLKYLKFEL